jgi:hypothetical protein
MDETRGRKSEVDAMDGRPKNGLSWRGSQVSSTGEGEAQVLVHGSAEVAEHGDGLERGILIK